MLRETTGADALTFEVGQSFAPEDALHIRAVIERAAPGTPVEIDFRRVRECHGFALALLAQDIVSGRARVAVRGMSKHQQRLLGYFGVPEGPQAAPEEPEVVSRSLP